MKKNEKKYTVKSFIEKFNNLDKEKINDFLDGVIVINYLPFEKKTDLCEKLVTATSYKNVKDLDGALKKKIYINTPARYMLYHLNLVLEYTNISVDMSKVLSEFNLLNNGPYLNAIISFIPEKEISEIKMLLEMTESDFMQNEYEITNYIDKKIESLGQRIGFGSEMFLKQFGESLDNLDEKKVYKLLDVISSMFKK